MSATNRGRERHARDFYPTPEHVVHQLFDDYEFLTRIRGCGDRWLEPCLGDGAIVHAVTKLLPRKLFWVGVDLYRPNNEPDGVITYYEDFIEWAQSWRQSERANFSVAITNPPFSLAFEIWQAMRLVSDTVVLLLRLNWLAGRKRQAALRADMPDVLVLPDRPCFTGDGRTDATEYAWMVWGREPQRHGRVHVLRTRNELNSKK